MKKQELISHVERISEEIAKELGYEIVDVDYVKEGPNWYLKIFADKEGGFSIDDCVALSRRVESALEENDPLETPYILEVSSPGLDRPLKKPKDFARSLGKLLEIRLFTLPATYADGAPCLLQEKEFLAKLEGYDQEKELVYLLLEDETKACFERKDFAMIRLAVIF